MPIYNFKARDLEGKKIVEAMEAASESALIAKLHQQKLLVLSVSEQREKKEEKFNLNKLFPQGIPMIGGGVKLASLLSFTTQLSAMVGAGLPLVQSLKGLSLDIKDKNFQEVIHQLGTDVSEGTFFSRALEKYPQIFNKIFVNLIRAGENSGKLGQILAQLTSYLEYNYNLRRKVISALIYPSVIVTFALLVVFVMVVAIIPKFEKIYHGFGKALPLPTQILLGVSSLIRNHFVLGSILVILLLVGGYLFSLTPRGRIIIDRIKLNLPVFGPIIKKSILSNFSRTLSVLVASGVPLVPALWLATQTINNLIISQNLTEIINSIEKGAGVGEGFKRKGFFPEMMVQMITTGEKAGSMDEMVLRAADFYEKQVDSTISTLMTLLEPIIIAGVGLLVGGIMLAMFLPVFKLGGIMHH